MMTPYHTRAAKQNLREGIKKMEKVMTVAAQVRRDFRLGRNPKPGESLPLHPRVVWNRAMEALLSFRTLMTVEKLKPADVTAAIVYITEEDPNTPRFLLLEQPGKSEEEIKTSVFERLGRPDALAIGMLFRQWDAEKNQQTTFPYQFTGLSVGAIAILRKAAEVQGKMSALTKDVN
jgi:hypothetical protein